MAAKSLIYGAPAREKVLRGATALADAVRVTLGPKSKSVLIGKAWGVPIVCNDGVTIAKEIELKDKEEDLGAKMLRQAAERTGDTVGDGTTTSTLLAHAIYAEGLRNVAAGASAVLLRHGIERGAQVAIASLKEMARPVKTRKEKAQVATVAAHNEAKVGELVADAIERVGPEGAITVEEAKGTETTLEVVEGMQFDRGFLSPYFVSDPEKMECVLEDAFVLIHEPKISAMKPLLPLLETVAKAGRPLLVIAEDVEGDALATLAVNKLRGTLASCAVKAPGYGDRRRAMLEDIAVLTKGRVVTEELGIKLESIDASFLGRTRRVVVDKDTTTLIGGNGDKKAITGRIEQIRRALKEEESTYEKEKLQERLAKLSGGVAVIHVGAPSESEMKNEKEAFEDAISAAKAAVTEGILPGAGLAYLRASKAVEKEEAKCDGDERTGMRIVRRALEVPTRQIAVNSDADAGVVVERMLASPGAIGFDASTNQYVDLFEAGIVDAAKVARIALENAVSVAGVLLLTEATLTDLPQPEKPAMPERDLA
jgi:chaperonin GroEL